VKEGGARAPLLEARGIGKRFGGVVALEGVDLHVGRGEVLALLGENGAGKSTLMKILAGVQAPDAGEVRVDGRGCRFAGVREALAAGIALIHQELNLASNLDVAGNLFLGREPRRAGFIDRGRMEREARGWLAKAGLDVDPATPVEELSIGRRQLVEIAKALAVEARVVIFDEPTSSLSEGEARRLFEVIDELRASGVAVIYITHRLREVTRLADRVSVLRDGRHVGDLGREGLSEEAMIRLMVGRDLEAFFPRHHERAGGERRALLEVSGLRTRAFPEAEVGLRLGAGEIVGLAGLVGSGRSELLRAVFGVDRRLAGEVRVAGEALASGSPRAAIRAGVALVPEDRKVEGLVLPMGLDDNLNLLAGRGEWWRRPWRERERAAAVERQLRIKGAGGERPVGLLSGGNQQKVALGKWLAGEPRVLLLDEPTRGIDVGAKREIYEVMERLAGAGAAVLFVSSELPEVLALADRVLVMRDGGIAGELARGEADEESIMWLAAGEAASEG